MDRKTPLIRELRIFPEETDKYGIPPAVPCTLPDEDRFF